MLPLRKILRQSCFYEQHGQALKLLRAYMNFSANEKRCKNAAMIS